MPFKPYFNTVINEFIQEAGQEADLQEILNGDYKTVVRYKHCYDVMMLLTPEQSAWHINRIRQKAVAHRYERYSATEPIMLEIMAEYDYQIKVARGFISQPVEHHEPIAQNYSPPPARDLYEAVSPFGQGTLGTALFSIWAKNKVAGEFGASLARMFTG